MKRVGITWARLVSLVMGLALSALPVLAFAQSDDGSGAAAAIVLGFYCVCLLVWLAVVIGITYWIYNDAKKRANPNAVLWAVVGFFLNIVGLLLYILVGRNQGTPMGGPPPAGPTGPSTTARY